jgi:hypothetical protein
MKKIILFPIVLAVFSISALAQVAVPDAVKSAFAKKFPAAQSVKWSEEKEGVTETVYEAEFKLKDKVSSANFNGKGEWQETELTVVQTDLPADVLKTITSQFAGYTLGEMTSVETSASKVYDVFMKKGREKIEVTFDLHGRIVKKIDARKKV